MLYSYDLHAPSRSFLQTSVSIPSDKKNLSDMSDRLPPLTALRAFEAAARHLSFAQAAEELHVTPAALSFQIKSLEAHLGQQLFVRLNRAVELTPVGKVMLPGLTRGFDHLYSAWRAAQRYENTTHLTVTAGPAITAKWLAPRLYAFVREYRDIDIRLAAGLAMADFERDDVDVAIRFGYGEDEGLFSETIMDEWLAPMGVAELVSQIKSPQDLYQLPLIHQEDARFLDPPCDWPAWFRAVGAQPPETINGPSFSQADHAIDAALSGAGIILARIRLASRYVKEGRLILPFKTALKTEASFRFLCLKGAERRPQVQAFLHWVRREVHDMQALDHGQNFVSATDVAPKNIVLEG